jgi:hypothetical protein
MLKLRAYWLLSKPRVTLLVWLTTVAGLALGGWGQTLQGGRAGRGGAGARRRRGGLSRRL